MKHGQMEIAINHFNVLKNLARGRKTFGESKNLRKLISNALTIEEFEEGHVQGSKNIPLNTIGSHLDEIKNLNKPVITCCRSGARSGSAATILKQHGVDAINGGPWGSVVNCIK